MGDEYVVDGAGLACSLGTGPGSLTVPPSRNVILRGKKRANIGDCVPSANVSPFGSCLRTAPPSACTPACTVWEAGKDDVLIQGMPALLDSSFALCPLGGGVITIFDSGQ